MSAAPPTIALKRYKLEFLRDRAYPWQWYGMAIDATHAEQLARRVLADCHGIQEGKNARLTTLIEGWTL